MTWGGEDDQQECRQNYEAKRVKLFHRYCCLRFYNVVGSNNPTRENVRKVEKVILLNQLCEIISIFAVWVEIIFGEQSALYSLCWYCWEW